MLCGKGGQSPFAHAHKPPLKPAHGTVPTPVSTGGAQCACACVSSLRAAVSPLKAGPARPGAAAVVAVAVAGRDRAAEGARPMAARLCPAGGRSSVPVPGTLRF